MAGCCVAQCQAPVQAVLRPGVWLPGVKKLHDFEEEWEIAASLEKVSSWRLLYPALRSRRDCSTTTACKSTIVHFMTVLYIMECV